MTESQANTRDGLSLEVVSAPDFAASEGLHVEAKSGGIWTVPTADGRPCYPGAGPRGRWESSPRAGRRNDRRINELGSERTLLVLAV